MRKDKGNREITTSRGGVFLNNRDRANNPIFPVKLSKYAIFSLL